MSRGLMSQDRNTGYLDRHRIIYRSLPDISQATREYDWGYFYQDGTHDCYELFRSKAKITTYKSLKWHLLVLWYLNPELDQDSFKALAEVICEKSHGFVTFTVDKPLFEKILYEVYMSDLDTPPRNRARKIIFKQFCGLSVEKKLSIVGQLVGRGRKVHEDDIYQTMLEIHDFGKKITIRNLAETLGCSDRTIHRNMPYELKKEKQLLNFQLEEI